MDAGAANVISQGYLKGAYDVLEALLGSPFIYDTTEMNDLDAATAGDLMSQYSVGLRAAVLGGGAVAMLFEMKDAAGILAVMEGAEAGSKDSLDDADLATFKEIGDSVLGGGVANLSEKFGEDVELENPDVVIAGSEGAEALTELLGECTFVKYTFKADPHFDSTAVLIFSHALESRTPSDLVDSLFGDSEEAGGEQLVSDEEMQDILSGFDPGDDAIGGGGAELGISGNLDVILDIDLIATVRLGQIEMPIADVLRLGPGSIIEVGQLVDDPVELLVNGKLVARGDVVVVDEKFGLRITEIVSRLERIESLR